MIQMQCDISGALAGVEDLLGRDIPFTIARFLTMQAKTGQAAAVEKEKSGIFTLRNDWTTRNTKITPATKTTLLAEVFTDTSNRKSGAPDYLPLQDDGGEKVPHGGHRYLAIPTKYLRKIVSGPIPDALRPGNLLPANATIGEEYSGNFRSNTGGAKARRGVSRVTRKALQNGEYVAFRQRTKQGTLCIFVRHGGIAHKGANHDAEPWYTLVDEAHIKAVFPMEQVVGTAVTNSSEENFNRALLEVLTNRDLGWARVTL